MTLSLNGLTVTKIDLWTPYVGTWVADVDLDLGTAGVVPTGKAVLVVGTQTLLGTIDPNAAGKHGERAQVRVLGGGGGWHKEVPAQQFHNDAGLLSSAIFVATAAEVGEVVTDLAPATVGNGVDHLREAGPASTVFGAREWHVDPITGVTIAGPRVPVPQTPDVQVLQWDPIARIAEVASDTLLAPGTILVDANIGTTTVRDVRQIFTAGSARATAYCGSESKARLLTLLGNLVKQYGRSKLLGTYHYVVVSNGPDGRVTAAAKSREAGIPDAILLPDWYGVPGMNATPALMAPGTECAVSFLDGDPAKPFVHAYRGGDELATGVATQGSMAAFMTALATLNTALTTLLNSVSNPASAALDPTFVMTNAVASAAVALTATIPAAFSLKTKAS